MNELKIVLFPLLTLLGVLLFAGIAGNTLWVRLGEVRKNLEAAGKENNTLGQKVEVLQRKSDQDTFLVDKKLTLALPPRSSSIYVVSQAKKKAADNLVIIQEITVSEPKVQSELAQSTTSLSVEGYLGSILNFIDSLSNVAPLIKTDNIEFGGGNNLNSKLIDMTVNLTSYYSPYPETIPALNQPINALTSSEEQVINDVSNLEVPGIPQELGPQSAVDRADPFTF